MTGIVTYRIFYLMQLSESQKKAVEYFGSPQIILAGAGSGKTRVIVAKSQYLIEQKGFAPESLLVITFSRKTQAELEERMADMGTSAPEVMTFHSFGMEILEQFGGRLGLPGEVVKAGEYRLRQILKSAVSELRESVLLSSGRQESIYYDLERFISRAKDELTSPEEIVGKAEEIIKSIPSDSDDDEQIVLRDRWQRVLEAGRIYQSYERLKAENGGLIDYGDMIYLSHKLLSSHKIVGAEIRQRIKYIMVDEFQDTNYGQVQMLYHLWGGKLGITVVGDDDQAIYRFRGASFGSFKLFMSLFPGAKEFKLEENYRSSANIVRSAQSVIESDPEARFDPGKKMLPVGQPGEKVKVRFCSDDITEAESAASEIELLLQSEEYRKPRSIAVLFRSRRHKNLLEELLQRRGISYYYDQKTKEASSAPARLLSAVYGFIADNGRADLLLLIIRYFVSGLTPAEEREIGYRLSRESGDPLDILKSSQATLNKKSVDDLRAMNSLLEEFGSIRGNKDPIRLLERIISRCELLSSVIVDGRIVDRRALNEITGILKAAESFGQEEGSASHGEFLEYLDWWSVSNDTSNGPELESTEAPVVLLTVHGSKGLEYPVVFVIGLSNRKFPATDKKAEVDFPPELYKDELPAGDFRIQEERRLFYVAMTRAKDRLYLYGVKKRGSKISRFVDEFLDSGIFDTVGIRGDIEESGISIERHVGPDNAIDIPKAVIMPINDSTESTVSDSLFSLWKAVSSGITSHNDFDKTKADFKKQVEAAVLSLDNKLDADKFTPPEPGSFKVKTVSYSDLEAFDTCPLQFYYKKALNMPSPSNPYMIFGSTIHSVLEGAARRIMEGKEVTYDDLAADYETRWGRVRLDDPDQKERMRQGGYNLLRYFLKTQPELKGEPLELERKFAVDMGDIKLTGRIDRVDKTSDGLEIIDYKTGKMDSKKLKGDLQLPIYSLACKDIYKEYPVRLLYMFLKDEQIHDEKFDGGAIESVKAEIIEKVERIKSSDFAATPGFQCRNCAYNTICPAAEK